MQFELVKGFLSSIFSCVLVRETITVKSLGEPVVDTGPRGGGGGGELLEKVQKARTELDYFSANSK